MKTKEDEVKEEEVKDEAVEENDEETTDEATEEVEEEVVEEEPTDEEVKETAEKLFSYFQEKVNESVKSNNVVEKKRAIFDTPNVTVNEPQVELYTKKNGEKIMIGKSSAEHLGKWFQNFVMFGKTKRPDYFEKLNSEYQTLEKIAARQKVEPLQTGVAAEGGNLVPTILFNELVPLIEDKAVIRPNARVIDMKGIKTLDLAGIQTKPQVSWNAEAAQKATTSAQFNKISLTPYILAGIIPVTTQLIDDSPFNVVMLVGDMLAEAIAREEDRAFILGSGTGQPTGIDNYTAVATIAAGGALRFTHLNTAYMRMPQGHRVSSKACWIMHAQTIETVLNLQDGNNRPIVNVNDPLAGGMPTIRGKKILENNDMDINKIFFVDLAYYWIGVSRTLSIDTADQATIGGKFDSAKGGGTYIAPTNLWERNMIAIRAEEKLDGELVTTRAFVEIGGVRT